MDVSLLDQLATSVDCQFDDKVVINNGRPDSLRQWQRDHPDWRVLSFGGNLGVAASWNCAPLLWPSAKSYLICNDDVVFTNGALKEVMDVADRNHLSSPVMYLENLPGYCCFVWTKESVWRFGLFDENFYPGYYEDSEMRVRLKVGGVEPLVIFDRPGAGLIHFKPPCGQAYSAMIRRAVESSKEYFWRKWGCEDHHHYGENSFKHPFNDAKLPIGFWRVEPARRRELFSLWDSFALANPSPYL